MNLVEEEKRSHSKNLSHLNLIQKKNYLELIQGIFFSLYKVLSSSFFDKSVPNRT